MRKIIRRIITLMILAGLGYGFYWFGNIFLWPPPDRSTIRAVGMVEAPEVNITSRIAGRITDLKLLEGDRVTRGQVICRIEDIDIRNRAAQGRGGFAAGAGQHDEREAHHRSR